MLAELEQLFGDGTTLGKGTRSKVVFVAAQSFRIKFHGHAVVRRIRKRFVVASG